MNRLNLHLGVLLLSLGIVSSASAQAQAQETPAEPVTPTSSESSVPAPAVAAPAPQTSAQRSRAALTTLADVLDQSSARLDQLEARGPGAAAGGGGEVTTDDIDELREEIEDTGSRIDDVEESLTTQMEKRMIFSGYSTSYFEKQQDQDSFFRGFRINLIFNHYITKTLRFYGEIEFEDPAAVGENKGAIEGEAGYIEFMPSTKIGVRTGIFLMPFGYYNQHHEGWRYAFRSRPLVNESIFPSTYADVGVMLRGTPLEQENFALHYEVAVSNGLGDGVSYYNTDGSVASGKGLRGTLPTFGSDNNEAKGITGRVSANIGESLEVGASGLRSVMDKVGNQLLIGGVDVTYTKKNFVARAEAISVRADQLTKVDSGMQQLSPNELSGALVEAEQRFFPDALKDTFLGKFADPNLFVAARYDYGRTVTPNVMNGTRQEHIVTTAIGYRPLYRSAFRLEYLKGFGDIGVGDKWKVIASASIGY